MQANTYDNDDQLATVTNSNASAALVMDSDGRLSTLTVKNVTTTYGYDNDSRLTSLSYVGSGNTLGNLTYSYDAESLLRGIGGSFAQANVPPAVSASYSNTNQVQTWNSVNASIDKGNNLTLDPSSSNTYSWDSRNMISTVGGSASVFGYDAWGRRETTKVASVTSSYLHDDEDVIETVSGTSTVTYLRLPDSGQALAQSSKSGSTTTTLVPLIDQLGSTIALVDSSGNIPTQFVYNPFGKVTVQGASSSYPFRFAGMEYDSSTGLYHTSARYYSPQLQRFLSEDPMGLGGGDANLFSYSANSPTNFTDPSGQCIYDGCIDLTIVLIAAGSGSNATFWGWLSGLFSSGAPSVPLKDLFPHHGPHGARLAGVQPDETPTQSTYVTRVAAEEDEEEEPGFLENYGLPRPIEGGLNPRGPANWDEFVFMRGVMKGFNQGETEEIMQGKIKDPNFSREEGWRKMQQVFRTPEGNVTIHYFENVNTRVRTQFHYTSPPLYFQPGY